jgi:hypothetical protein
MHRGELDSAAARIAAHYQQAGETAKVAPTAHKIQYGIAYAETMAHLQQKKPCCKCTPPIFSPRKRWEGIGSLDHIAVTARMSPTARHPRQAYGR